MYGRATKLHWLTATTTGERNGKRGNRSLTRVRFPPETRWRPLRRCAKKTQKRGQGRKETRPRDSLLLYKRRHVVFWSIIVLTASQTYTSFKMFKLVSHLSFRARFVCFYNFYAILMWMWFLYVLSRRLMKTLGWYLLFLTHITYKFKYIPSTSSSLWVSLSYL